MAQFQALDLLGPGQQAGLLGVGGVKSHGEGADRMAGGRHDDLAVAQLTALRQGAVQIGGGVDTGQPVAQQCLERVLAVLLTQTQQVRQPGQTRAGGVGGRACGRAGEPACG